jgi:hypothetical protein
MIQTFVDRFTSAEGQAAMAALFAKHPSEYKDIVKAVVSVVASADEYDDPDPERIHEINDGDYRGTLVFVIAAKGYQPSRYWYVKVGYGSCSGCDTLQAIHSYSDEPPSESQLKDYMTLALHIVQGLKEMGADVV